MIYIFYKVAIFEYLQYYYICLIMFNCLRQQHNPLIIYSIWDCCNQWVTVHKSNSSIKWCTWWITIHSNPCRNNSFWHFFTFWYCCWWYWFTYCLSIHNHIRVIKYYRTFFPVSNNSLSFFRCYCNFSIHYGTTSIKYHRYCFSIHIDRRCLNKCRMWICNGEGIFWIVKADFVKADM